MKRAACIAASAALVLAGGLSACESTAMLRAENRCGYGDSRAWTLLSRPPARAAEMQALAAAHPNFPVGPIRWTRWFWFVLPSGEVMLCGRDAGLHHFSCSEEWWQFRENDGVLAVSAQDSSLCVT